MVDKTALIPQLPRQIRHCPNSWPWFGFPPNWIMGFAFDFGPQTREIFSCTWTLDVLGQNFFLRWTICEYIIRYLGGEDSSLNMKFIYLVSMKAASAASVVSYAHEAGMGFTTNVITAQGVVDFRAVWVSDSWNGNAPPPFLSLYLSLQRDPCTPFTKCWQVCDLSYV